MTIIRDSFERAQLLRATHGTWIVASLVTEMFWPLKAQSADYEGKEFLFLPMVRTEGATASNPLAVDLLCLASITSSGVLPHERLLPGCLISNVTRGSYSEFPFEESIMARSAASAAEAQDFPVSSEIPKP
jgi:hypothetical protein